MELPLNLILICGTLLLGHVSAREISSFPTYFPDETGTEHLIVLQDFDLNDLEITHLIADLNTINFILYTRNNPTNGDYLKIGDANSIIRSHWNENRPTRIVTHGWSSSPDSKSCTLIRNAYLAVGDYNVIVIGWKEIAGNKLYGKVASSVPHVAQHVATFLKFMQAQGKLQLQTTLMVGHSLGAHIVGIAARNVNDVVAEVVGLDPAGPGFTSAQPDQRIDVSDARYVQIIHTNAGKLGLSANVGTADFHVNGGKKQPGCSIWDIVGKCDHGRVYEYFAESIRNSRGFRGTTMNCSSACKSAYMGGQNLDHSARGAYTLQTADKSPFALG